jgi:hypothetical protein
MLRPEPLSLTQPRRHGLAGGGGAPLGVLVHEDPRAGLANAVMAKVHLRSIARDLRTLGVPTEAGTQWSPTGVRDVLLRPRNAGLMVHREAVHGRSK